MQEAFAFPQETLSANQITNVNLLKMVFAPSAPQIAYIGTRASGVYRSNNGGLIWQSAGLGEETVLSLAVDLIDPNLVYAASDISGSLKISTDGGSSWNNTSLPVYFYSLTASPLESGVVYAGTSSGIYRYKSGNWSPLGLSDQSVTAITLDPARPGLILAGTISGAYYSTNDGLSWIFVDDQLSGQTIQSIYFDRTIPNVFYFSTKNHGIFLTEIRF
jgi:ligand-binding sensor domain-containing protein